MINFTPPELSTPELTSAERTEDAVESALGPALDAYRRQWARLRGTVPFALLDALDIMVNDLVASAYDAGHQAGRAKAG